MPNTVLRRLRQRLLSPRGSQLKQPLLPLPPSPKEYLWDEEAPVTQPETLVTCLLILLNAYRCSACPGLALCITRHFHCLETHPRASLHLRQLASNLHQEWLPLAGTSVHPTSTFPGN